MSEIERIERYIGNTEINTTDAIAIKHMEDQLDAVYMAFLYGRAKGYWAAKAEQRKAVQG